ncbi:MAG TPA: 8-amino-7-oxononanoate synthase [Sunxiuqinia sp.]|nr:8-amino-7-oxononanoate synthase [Sunxiuqinia sp.]
MKTRFNQRLIELEQQSNLRRLPEVVPKGMINLSSNDYLGIGSDQNLKAEFLSSHDLLELDFSAVSSRLLTGNSDQYRKLENTIQQAYQREACLVFNSGYHANIGILPALAGKHDLILADKMVHASIIDGMKLCPAEVRRFSHLNYNHLESLLIKYRSEYEQVFIVTEGVFSMDGDLANLHELVRLKKQFDTFLYVDEAHALGVFGEKGLGLAEQSGLIDEVDFLVGTFGKAIASIGAFVVCDGVFKNYLVNTSRSLIFTTALPPVNLAWTNFIFQKLPDMNERRAQLSLLSKEVSYALGVEANSHIVPLILGENEWAVRYAMTLRELGYYVLPIRQPTVPVGTARLRFSLYAGLEFECLDKLINTLMRYEEKVG